MPAKLQGAIVLGLGITILLAGAVGSIALLTGASSGSSFPHWITGFGLVTSLLGWVGFREMRANFNAIPWAMGLLLLSLIALGIFGQP